MQRLHKIAVMLYDHVCEVIVEDRVVRARNASTVMLTQANLFAVLVLWSPEDRGAPPWTGWLTTILHCAAHFSPAGLADPHFREWLAALPGWEPARLACAIARPGLHLVWRRYAD